MKIKKFIRVIFLVTIILNFLLSACSQGFGPDLGNYANTDIGNTVDQPGEVDKNPPVQEEEPVLTYSLDTSLLEVSSDTVVSGSSVNVMLSILDNYGEAVPYTGLNVSFFHLGGTSTGIFSAVNDNGDGTYSALFTGIVYGTETLIYATINDETVTSAAPGITVERKPYSLAQSIVSVDSDTVNSNYTTEVMLTVRAEDGEVLNYPDLTITFFNMGGTSIGSFGSTSDNEDGTYSAIFTGEIPGTPTNIGARIGSDDITSVKPQLQVLQTDYSLSNSIVSVSSNTVNSGSSITVSLAIKDDNNIDIRYPGLTVLFSISGGTSTGFFGTVNEEDHVTYTTYSTTFTGQVAGTAIEINATINGLNVTSEKPQVTVDVGNAVGVYIENADGGSGSAINTASLIDGTNLTLYAVSRDVYGNFVQDESVTWLCTNSAGTFSTSVGSSVIFQPATVNLSTVITADHSSLNDDTTGTITIYWTNLAVSWRLEENGTDESGNNNILSPVGSVLFADGKIGKAGSYDATGTNYHSAEDSSSLDLSTEGCVSAWIYMNTFVDGGGVVHKGDKANWSDEVYSLQLWSASSKHIYFGTTNTSDIFVGVESATALNINQWYNTVGCFKSNSIYIYINGVLDKSISASSLVSRNTNASVNIGVQLKEQVNTTNKNYPFDGIIDQVTIWNKNLSLSEIQYLYNSGNSR